MRTSTSASAAFALLFAVLAPLAGCSSSSDGAPVKTIEKVCTKTACDAKESRDSSACSRCLDACSGASYNCDSSSACALSCGSSSDTTCSDSERSQCIQQSIVVHLNEEPSAELLASCGRMFDHLTSCHLEIRGKTKAACAVWAKVEKAENARYYDCITNLGCSSDVSDCQPPTTTLGEEICDALNAKVGSDTFCNAKERVELDENGAWWKDDVIAVERSCLALPDKDDAVRCHWAWRAAVGF
jgi:hypothetical protein